METARQQLTDAGVTLGQAAQDDHTKPQNTMRSDFLDGTDDREKFWEMFEVTKNNTDYVQSSDIQVMVRSESLNVTSRRYNRWLRAEGCEVGARETMNDGKRVRVVKGLKRKREEPMFT